MAGELALDTASRGSSSAIRTFGPRDVEDQFHLHKKKDEIRALLSKIEKIYERLQLGNDLGLEKEICIGFLDPATNILINAAVSRRRGRGGERGADMNQRSLDGLIAFLTCLFPYLPDAEARVYLDAAEADPFVASLYIIRRRGMREFDLNSQTTVAAVEVALRCAAVAAKHPDPQGFVRGWKSFSSVAGRFGPTPSRMTKKAQHNIVLRAQKMVKAFGAIDDPCLQLKMLWDRAKRRLMQGNAKFIARPKELPPARAPMKRMLLATIHGFYLQAMGMLPTVELSYLHQSMLLGGYCYGPLDPVSNIIVNTIWYQQNFPPSNQFEVSMISTKLLWRIAAQSLYGLISFLCTRYRGLTPDLAMQRLLVAGVNLRAADPKLSTNPSATGEMRLDFSDCAQVLGIGDPSLTQRHAVEESTPSASIAEAYTAAAKAACHSYHLAHGEFLASLSGMIKDEFVSEVILHIPSLDGGPGSAYVVRESVSQVLHKPGGGPLSSQDLDFVRTFLCKYISSTSESHQEQDLAPRKVTRALYAHVNRCTKRFWGQHERVTKLVTNAMRSLNRTAGDTLFDLHIICGVNEFVSGPVPSKGENVGDYNPWTYAKYCHTHINFLAVRKNRPSDPPLLFFAECGKDGADSWCVPVIRQKPEAEQVRCIYCEYEGNRLVHPAERNFFGRDEFEKFYEPHTSYTNNRLIEDKQADVDWVHGVTDDGIYYRCYADGDDCAEVDLIIC